MSEQVSQDMSESSFLHSCKVIFGITFGQTIRSKKTVAMLIVTFLPVLLAVCYRILGRDVPPEQPFSRIVRISPEKALSLIMPFFLQFLSVLVALFYATALFADEIDNRTIIHLFTRPIRRYSIVVGKFAAYMLEVFIVLVPPMVLTFLIIATDDVTSSDFAARLGLFGKGLGVITLALIVYGAVFTFFGARLKRPVLFGLIFAFGWEKMVLAVPGVIGKFSVIHYLVSVLPPTTRSIGEFHMMIKGISFSSPALSIVILLVITSIFLGLSIFTIYRREYRFE
jgi:ABC-type transport system involved in multi-copper enzyme maturation permease subunit